FLRYAFGIAEENSDDTEFRIGQIEFAKAFAEQETCQPFRSCDEQDQIGLHIGIGALLHGSILLLVHYIIQSMNNSIVFPSQILGPPTVHPQIGDGERSPSKKPGRRFSRTGIPEPSLAGQRLQKLRHVRRVLSSWP